VLRVDCKCLRADFVCLWVCLRVGWGLFCDDGGVLGVECECLWAEFVGLWTDFVRALGDCGLVGGGCEFL